MKLSNEAQVLLERYLLGVKRNLPGKKGKDITEEVRSYLLDSLEEQYPKAAQISEKQLLNVLEKLGSPRKLAAQYSPRGAGRSRRTRAGPRWARRMPRW